MAPCKSTAGLPKIYGLWLAPLGWLVAKSGTIPRILGVFLILGCVGYVAHFFLSFFIDGYRPPCPI